MKKLYLALFITSLAIFAKAQAPKEKTLLWKVTGNSLKHPSYLFGTMHLLCPSDIQVSTEMKKTLDASRQVFLELDMDDPSVMIEMMKGLTMKNDTSLNDLLSQPVYDSVAKLFQKLSGMPITFFNKAKPMLAMSAIYPALLKCNPDGWEKVLVKIAKEQDKPVKGLEDVKDQIAVFETIPYKQQAEALAATLMNIDSTKKMFNLLLSTYKARDLPKLLTLMSEDKSTGDFEALLLKNRNEKWIPVIEKEAAATATFFAVGAAHLAGKSGVIALLRKKGYTVEPVYY